MKKFSLITIVLTTSLTSTVVLADTDTENKVSIEQAIQKARELGYTQIREIELEDGSWEGQGYKADKRDYEFRLDGETGEVKKDELD